MKTPQTFTYEVFKALPIKEEHALLIDISVWADIICENGFPEIFEPISKLIMVKNGILGTLDGVPIYTDAFFESGRFLQRGTVYLAREEQITIWLADRRLPEWATPVFTERD